MNEKPIFIFYILLFLAAAITLALFQPHVDTPPLYANPPDEHAKFLMPRYICEHGTLPSGYEEEIRLEGYGFSYAFYNVFPFIVAGYFMRLVSVFNSSEQVLLYAARSISIISGLLMALVIYLLSRKLFSDRRFAWLFCFLAMFLPQQLFMHSYLNNDSMTLLSTAMMVYAWVSIGDEGYRPKNMLFLSGGIIICALSYYNAYAFILCSMLLFFYSFISKKEGRFHYDWKEMLRKGCFIGGLVLLGIAWWFVRSYHLHGGDIIGFRSRDAMAVLYGNPQYFNTYAERGYSIGQMLMMSDFFPKTLQSFIAAYGSMAMFANVWIYRLYGLLLGLGVACFICFKNRFAKEKGFNAFFHFNMVFCLMTPLFLLIFYAHSIDFQAQGRYLLPGVIPLMYYVAAGFEKLARFLEAQYLHGRIMTNVLIISVDVFIVACLLWMVYKVGLPVYFSLM